MNKKLIKNTEGLSTVEYVILLMLIAVVGIVAWRTFGNTVVSKVNSGVWAEPNHFLIGIIYLFNNKPIGKGRRILICQFQQQSIQH